MQLKRFGLLALILCLLLMGCGEDEKPEPAPEVTREPLSAVTPAMDTLSPIYVRLQRDYEGLQAGYEAINAVWEKLASGEQVQCGEYPTAPSPASISDEGDSAYATLAETLRRAAIATEEAINLWKAECQNPRPLPSPDMIDQGRLAARAAGDALREAEGMLSGIQ